MEVGRRRRAANLKSQQSHLVVNYSLLNGQPVQRVEQRRGVGSFARDPKDCEFESRPVRFQVTTLGKLLTRMCLCHKAV